MSGIGLRHLGLVTIHPFPSSSGCTEWGAGFCPALPRAGAAQEGSPTSTGQVAFRR